MSPTLARYVADPLERAGATFVEQFVWVLVGSAPVSLLVTQNYLFAFDAAAFAGIVSLITSLLTFALAPKSPPVDLAWRVAKTFLQSVLGTLQASAVTSVSHADWRFALAVAFPVAMTALLKGLGALALPWTGGASLLPVALTAQRDRQPDYPTPDDLDYPDISYVDDAGQPTSLDQAVSAAKTVGPSAQYRAEHRA